MGQPRYSDVLVATNVATAAAAVTTLATVPAGEAWVLRTARLYAGVVAVAGVVRLGVARGGVNYYFANATFGAAGDLLQQDQIWVVLEAGDAVIQASGTVASFTGRAHISGYRLTA